MRGANLVRLLVLASFAGCGEVLGSPPIGTAISRGGWFCGPNGCGVYGYPVVCPDELLDPGFEPDEIVTTSITLERVPARAAVTDIKVELGSRTDFTLRAIGNSNAIVLTARVSLMRWVIAKLEWMDRRGG